MDLERAVGRIEGAIDAQNRAVNDKFTAIMCELKEQKAADKAIEKRVTVIEIDRKVVSKLAAVIGGTVSIITTSLITLGIRLLS